MDYLSSVSGYAGFSALLLWFIFTVTFIIAKQINLWKILDISWGLGFMFVVVLGWISFTPFQITPHMIPIGLVLIWGLRLTIYLTIRGGKKEDERYESFKKSNILLQYINVFLSQALFIWLMCIPFYFYMPITSNILAHPLNIFISVIGALLCIFALTVEWTSDYQLRKFKHPNQLVKDGLWKYSRHPNYFGESTFWWGIWITTQAIGTSHMVPGLFISMLSPLTIMFIVYIISGPISEKYMSKYPDWEEYKSHTPYIFPIKFK